MSESESYDTTVDHKRNRYPFCIVWTPIPLLTWIFPFIGHTGIATSQGIIYDFAGPYTIGREHLAFGIPTRYLQCTILPEQVEVWDQGIAYGCALYETRMHNLCCDNCHSHVAVCLEKIKYKGRSHWNMVMICFWMFVCGSYTDLIGFIKTWGPFTLLMMILCMTMI